MSYNAMNCITVVSFSLYQCISSPVARNARWFNAASKYVVWHGRCVYNVIVGNGILDAMLINGDGKALNADNAKRSCFAGQEFFLCVIG